jgi:anti-anti-sigma regulatory factor
MTANGTITVTPQDGNGTWLVELAGEHDISTASLLDQGTSGVWPTCTLAVVDLSDVTFIDCSVLNWLIRTRSTLAETGDHALRIIWGPPGSLGERIFKLVWLRDELSFYSTRADALAQTSAAPKTARAVVPGGATW